MHLLKNLGRHFFGPFFSFFGANREYIYYLDTCASQKEAHPMYTEGGQKALEDTKNN